MRSLEFSTEQWKTIIGTFAEEGYTDLAISWNRMNLDYAINEIVPLIKTARLWSKMRVNITTDVENDVIGVLNELPLRSISEITFSCDDIHGYESIRHFNDLLKTKQRELLELKDTRVAVRDYINVNLLWTRGVFDWLFRDPVRFKRDIAEMLTHVDRIQHLMLKPLSLYGKDGSFGRMYRRVVTQHPDLWITGNGKEFLGDAAMNNLIGANECPSDTYEMVDIDPMGNVRRCPENPDIFFNLNTLYSNTNHMGVEFDQCVSSSIDLIRHHLKCNNGRNCNCI